MRRRRLPRALLIVVGMLIVLIAFLGVGAVTMGNDLICSTAERRAMSEFPHYDGAEPSWESNLKITGGCTTSYTVQATPDEVRAYYRERLVQSGWTVQVGPANSFPIHLEADRDGLRYFLMFEGPDAFEPTREQELKQAQAQEQGSGHNAVGPGQTRVSISGGHRR